MTTILRFILFFLLAPVFAIVAQAFGSAHDGFRIVDTGFQIKSLALDRIEGEIFSYDSSGALLHQRENIDGEEHLIEYEELETSEEAQPLFSFLAELVAASKLKNLSKLEQSIVDQANDILNNKAFKEAITSGKPSEIVIDGRKIIIEPDAPMSGMTLFDEGAFVIGKEALGTPDELGKTVLHELHRLNTSVRNTGAGVGQATLTSETGSAASFAETAIDLLDL